MKKSIAIALIACLLVSAAFAGGGSESDSPKLVYWTMWNEAEPQGLVIAEAVEAFTEETGIEVEINFNGREIRKTLQPALDAGETIDIFDEDYERLNNAWGAYLLNLDDYMTKVYPTTGGKTYEEVANKALLDLVKQFGGGSYMVVPYQPSAFITMYNKDLFAKAGITSVPKTWDEFLDVCAKLKAIDVYGITVDDAYMGALFGYCMDRLIGEEATLAMVENNDFSNPGVLEFGKIWANMAKKGYISPKAASNIFPAGQVEEFAKNEVAMYLNGTWLPNEIKGSAPNMNWGSFAWPAMSPNGDGIETNHYGAQSFGINKTSKYPDEAFELAVWLTTGEWDEKLAAESLGIPAANDAEWPVQLADAKVIFEATTNHIPWACGMEFNPEINAKIKENFAKLILGVFTPEQFAAAMAK